MFRIWQKGSLTLTQFSVSALKFVWNYETCAYWKVFNFSNYLIPLHPPMEEYPHQILGIYLGHSKRAVTLERNRIWILCIIGFTVHCEWEANPGTFFWYSVNIKRHGWLDNRKRKEVCVQGTFCKVRIILTEVSGFALGRVIIIIIITTQPLSDYHEVLETIGSLHAVSCLTCTKL